MKSPIFQRDWDEAHPINAALHIHHLDPAFGYRFIAGRCWPPGAQTVDVPAGGGHHGKTSVRPVGWGEGRVMITIGALEVAVPSPFHAPGWYVAAGLLTLAAVFHQWVRRSLLAVISTASSWVQDRLAGSVLLSSYAIGRYRAAVLKNYGKLPLAFLNDHIIDIHEIYIPVRVAPFQRRARSVDAIDLMQGNPHIAVTGAPGAGKSMLLRYFMLSWARRERGQTNRIVPVLLELHRCEGSPGPLQDFLAEQLSRDGFPRPERFVRRALARGGLRIMMDGLDEVSSGERVWVLQMISDFITAHRDCPAVLTCRDAVYDVAHTYMRSVDLDRYSLGELDDQLIYRFLSDWPDIKRLGSAIRLMSALRDKPQIMRLARNPLLLTLIAYLYGGAYEGDERRLPHSRVDFYEQATDVLLYDLAGRFNRYEPALKHDLLTRLALMAQKGTGQTGEIIRIRSADANREAMGVLQHNYSTAEAGPLITEVVERSGLLQATYHGRYFQFAHITFQEYFSALALSEDPDTLIECYRSDPVRWREPVRLWCGATPLEATPVVRAVHEARSVLALECLADARQIDEHLADEIIDHYMRGLGRTASLSADPVISALAAVATDTRPAGQRVFARLVRLAQSPDDDDPRRDAAIMALAATDAPEAAEVLASLALRVAPARTVLVSMGDIALEALVRQARSDPQLIDDIAAMGTREAVRSLVLMLNEPRLVAVRAAWHVGALLGTRDGEKVLRAAARDVRGERLDWVWAPFRAHSGDPVALVAGRIAYLLDNGAAESRPRTLPRLDPRLVIPVCWVRAPQQLSGRIDRDANQTDWQAIRAAGMSPHHRVMLTAIDPRLRDALVARIVQVAGQHEPKARAVTFGSRASPYRIEDWEQVHRQGGPYQFATGWHYRAILAICLLVSVIALVQALRQTHDPWILGWLNWAAAIIIVWGWAYLVYVRVLVDPATLKRYGFLGMVRASPYLTGFHRLAASPCRILAALTGYLYLAAAASLVGWMWALFSLIPLVSIVLFLAWSGHRREAWERRENPLQGLLPPTREHAQPHAGIRFNHITLPASRSVRHALARVSKAISRRLPASGPHCIWMNPESCKIRKLVLKVRGVLGGGCRPRWPGWPRWPPRRAGPPRWNSSPGRSPR
jgi:NACHT domain